jgi:hypothetical protein
MNDESPRVAQPLTEHELMRRHAGDPDECPQEMVRAEPGGFCKDVRIHTRAAMAA